MDCHDELKIPTLHVTDIELPREFEKLYELAYNLWWSWTPSARSLFAAIDSGKWAHYRNPVEVLINVDPRHWYALLADESFLSRYRNLTEQLDEYTHSVDQSWFARHHGHYRGGPVAYFSMEYGLHQSLAIYSGGLGVLSGDHCKSASDLGLPMVAVGLLYRRGYFKQTIDAEGVQQHIYPDYDFTRLPLRPVATGTGREVVVSVPFPGRDIKAKLWLAQIGRVPLILLDTDLYENDPADRPITYQLYVRGREMRLVQEYLLGVGGARALEALGINPSVWHLNEGHSVFLQLERLRRLVAKTGQDAKSALEQLRHNAVFTTHTPVPAGNEQFDGDLVRKYLQGVCDEVGLPADDFHHLGQAHDGDAAFNLTALAIRTTSWTNGVSKLNAEVTSNMWRHVFTADPYLADSLEKSGDPPIRPITNGVHTSTWIGRELEEVLQKYLGPRWHELLLVPTGWDRVYEIPNKELWSAHRSQKARLGRFVREVFREQLARHGSSPDELRAVSSFFDPDALIVGFARRFATYKRAKLIFSDLERLRGLLFNDERPVQLLFAGKAHPADRPGQQLIQRIFELSKGEFAGRVFFLENYDMRMGQMLVQGVDVWLNNPRRPLEASGTSGQKVALNGGLNFSILDGWWPEGFVHGKNGWAIGREDHGGDENAQDWSDVNHLYETLGDVIVPLFYERDPQDLPHRWLEMMKSSIATLTSAFSADRMVRDYIEKSYLPAYERGREDEIRREASATT